MSMQPGRSMARSVSVDCDPAKEVERRDLLAARAASAHFLIEPASRETENH
jgi:hypothetical protein